MAPDPQDPQDPELDVTKELTAQQRDALQKNPDWIASWKEGIQGTSDGESSGVTLTEEQLSELLGSASTRRRR